MRVLSITTLNGIYHEMLKSLDSEKHHALMELRPEGVLVYREKLGWALVPFTNIAWIRVDPENLPAAFVKTDREERRVRERALEAAK